MPSALVESSPVFMYFAVSQKRCLYLLYPTGSINKSELGRERKTHDVPSHCSEDAYTSILSEDPVYPIDWEIN